MLKYVKKMKYKIKYDGINEEKVQKEKKYVKKIKG